MGEYRSARIDEIEAIFGGGFRRARSALGISSFGMQIIELPPNADGYPEHDHSEDGQEEVYVTLRGSGVIVIDGERVALDPETLVSVQPGTKRKLLPGDEGMRVLVLGGVAGSAYEVKGFTELGEPDPYAGGG